MGTDSLQIEILYEQPLEIQIEFPVAVLASYYGISNLDEIWDEHILSLITNSLHVNHVHIKRVKLTIEGRSEKNLGTISYQLLLIAKPPLFDFNWLLNNLRKAGFQRGMHLKLDSRNGIFESRYQDRTPIDGGN